MNAPTKLARPGYLALFRHDHVTPMVVWSVIGRLPTGVSTLLIVLCLIDAKYSGAASGVVIAVHTIVGATVAPLYGRLVDRGHARVVLVSTGLMHLVTLSALLGAAYLHVPLPVLAVLSGLWGLGSPPTNGITRPLWPRLVGVQLLPVAYSLEVLIVDALYVGGPILASIVASTVGPGYGMLATGVGVAVGSCGMAFTGAVRELAPRPRPLGPQPHERLRVESLFRNPAVWGVLLIGACLMCFSTWTEVMIPLQMNASGTPQWSGLLIAVWSVGSILGVLLFVRLQPRWSLSRQIIVFLSAYLIPAACLFLAGTGTASYGVVLFVVGVLVSPCTNIQMQLAHQAAPETRQAEMFTWTGTASQIGSSLGGFLSGFASDHFSTTVAVGGASTAIGAALVIALLLHPARRGIAALAGRGIEPIEPEEATP